MFAIQSPLRGSSKARSTEMNKCLKLEIAKGALSVWEWVFSDSKACRTDVLLVPCSNQQLPFRFRPTPVILQSAQWRSYLAGIDNWSSLSMVQGFGVAVKFDRASQVEISGRLEQYEMSRRPWPELKGDIGFAIVLLEHEDRRNRGALGFDMYSEGERRRAMSLAMATRRPASTLAVVLKQEIDGAVQPGFLIYVPVLNRATSRVDQFV